MKNRKVKLYYKLVRSGEIDSVLTLIEKELMDSNEKFEESHFSAAGQMDRATEFIAGQIIEDLVQQDNHPLQRKKALMEEYETSLIKLGLEFLDAAKNCDSDKLQEFIDADFPVNFQSPDLQESALHIVAAKGCYDSVKVLAGSGKCDYLLKDIYSRTAFSNSIFYADPEDAVDVVDLLEAETKAAAADAGIDLWESVRESRETFARHKHDLS